MEVFRISKNEYAAKLTASGVAARWNKGGEYVLYTGSSRSLSTLELIVHGNAVKPAIDYKLMVISIEDNDNHIERLFSKDLPKNWRLFSAYYELQKIGSDWYRSNRSLVLKVPSAIITNEFNYIINTRHHDFMNCITLVRTEDYFWDDRLLALTKRS